MRWRPLSETLVQLVAAVTPPPDTGLVVTEAELDIPLEVQWVERNGEPVFCGMPPHTRWKSGLLPPVHLGKLKVVLVEEEPSAR